MPSLAELHPDIAVNALQKFEAVNPRLIFGSAKHLFEIKAGNAGAHYYESEGHIIRGLTAILEVNLIDFESPNKLTRKILEMRPKFDIEGNLVGLEKEQFGAWRYPYARSNIKYTYQIDLESPELAVMKSVVEYYRPSEDEKNNFKNITFSGYEPYYPQEVNWLLTYDQLITGHTVYDNPLDLNYYILVPPINSIR